MAETTPQPPSDPEEQKVTPLRCLVGSAISGSLGFGLYSLTYAIAHTFARKPITFSNPLARNVASAVRTLVVGAASLGTFIFAFVAVGLILLAIQLGIQNWKRGAT